MKKLWISLVVVLLIMLVVLIMWQTRLGQEIPIGAIMPLTGDVASYGVAIKQGVELAVEKVNAEKGIRGRALKVIYEDSEADPKKGVAAAQKLISINGVPVIVGAVASSVTLAIAPVADREHTVLISPASSSPKITTAGDYIFRNYPSDELEGHLVAEFANDHGYKRAAVITINNDYGNGLNDVFTRAYTSGGGEAVLVDKYIEGTQDFRTLLAKAKAKAPDCIFIVGYGKELGTMVKQARELGITAQFLSTVNFYDPQSIATGGTAVEGVILSSPVFDAGSKEAYVQEFVTSYRKRFGKDPDVWSAHGYDALLLVAEAMRSTGIDADSIKHGLYNIRDFPGVSGVTSFDRNGDVIKQARFLTVKSGQFVPYN